MCNCNLSQFLSPPCFCRISGLPCSDISYAKVSVSEVGKWLEFAQFAAYDVSGNNVAQNADASASSVASNTATSIYAASFAVDGKTYSRPENSIDGVYKSDVVSVGTGDEYWRLNFGSLTSIERVVFYGVSGITYNTAYTINLYNSNDAVVCTWTTDSSLGTQPNVMTFDAYITSGTLSCFS